MQKIDNLNTAHDAVTASNSTVDPCHVKNNVAQMVKIPMI